MHHQKFDLLALGEILLRLSPPGNERIASGDLFEKHLGGAELNVASGVAMMGLSAGMISKLPVNSLGAYVKNQVRFAGVDDTFLADDFSQDARLGIYIYENGAYPRKPAVVYDRKYSSVNQINIDDFPESMYSSTRCFHTSGITLALSPRVRTAAMEMIRRFKAHGTLISFDVNFRANLWSGDEARACIEEILPMVDIFFCSEDTARLTFKKQGDIYQIMKSFGEEYSMSVIAATQRIVHSPKVHTFGSVIYNTGEDRFYTEEPYRNIEVIDRIGSGDAYVSGVLYGLLAHDFSCQRAMELGNGAGSLKNTVSGDLLLSDLKEITQIVEDHHTTGRVSEMNR